MLLRYVVEIFILFISCLFALFSAVLQEVASAAGLPLQGGDLLGVDAGVGLLGGGAAGLPSTRSRRD